MKLRFAITLIFAVALFSSCSDLGLDSSSLLVGDNISEFYVKGEVIKANPYTYQKELAVDIKDIRPADRMAFFALPEDVMSEMNAIDLAVTAIFYYPYAKLHPYVYNSPFSILGNHTKSYNGFLRLAEMKDAGKSLLSILEAMDFSTSSGKAFMYIKSSNSFNNLFFQTYMLAVLAQDTFVSIMTKEEQTYLLNLVNERIDYKKKNPDNGPELCHIYAVKARIGLQFENLSQDDTDFLELFIYRAGSVSIIDQDEFTRVDQIVDMNN
ncbi:MAG: hypothetical protein HUJ92_00180 [Bacteroidales bacterium]|nr:hypothetical protein [Bacteroidales bacterium]